MRSFRKQGKVCITSKTFIPVFGDLLNYMKYQKAGKFPLLYSADQAKQNPESKMSLMMFGNMPKLLVYDLELTDKILSMVGTKIDRSKGDFG